MKLRAVKRWTEAGNFIIMTAFYVNDISRYLSFKPENKCRQISAFNKRGTSLIIPKYNAVRIVMINFEIMYKLCQNNLQSNFQAAKLISVLAPEAQTCGLCYTLPRNKPGNSWRRAFTRKEILYCTKRTVEDYALSAYTLHISSLDNETLGNLRRIATES